MPPPYDKVQFIAFNIAPGKKTDTEYLGIDDDEKDMLIRCELMKEAIRTAWAHDKTQQWKRKYTNIARGVSNAVDSASILKLFMAPEFYFRGTGGGYPIDLVSEIVPEMRKETDQKKYEDWLFVFGTAIGYMERNKASARITAVDATGSTTKITLDSLPPADWCRAAVKEFVQADIKAITHPGGHRFEIALDTKASFPKGSNVHFFGPQTVKTEATSIIDSKVDPETKKVSITIQNTPVDPCKTCTTTPPCAKHVPNQFRPRLCQSCAHAHVKLPIDVGWRAEAELAKSDTVRVRTATDLGGGKYRLTLNKKEAYSVGSIVTLERSTSRKQTEIFNIAPIVKGAPLPSSKNPGLQEALVYKEYVSNLDFAEASSKKIMIHKQERPVLPTEGSTESRSKSKNVLGDKHLWTDTKGQEHEFTVSEINKSGIGGGGVLTIDGVTYGIEVCLDHRTHRLAKFYGTHAVFCNFCHALFRLGMGCPKCKKSANPNADFDPIILRDGQMECRYCAYSFAPGTDCGFCKAAGDPGVLEADVYAEPGDPRVQVHLIPSWGMSIGFGAGCCVDNGLIFNVDGDRAGEANASVVRQLDGEWGCDRHLAVKEPGPGRCSVKRWYCPTCYATIKDPNWGTAGSTCNLHGAPVARLDTPCGADLVQMGAAIDPEARAAVSMSAAQPNRQTFYDTDGEICVYPPKPIPAAETV